MMSEQKALVLDSPKGSFVVSTRPIPKPATGELLVKVQAVGLNPVDWKIQEYDVYVKDYPAVLGTDIAGDVEEIGEGVQGWKKGDKIYFQGWYANDYAAFQQYTLISADLAGKIPERYSYSQVASVSVSFNCAAFGLFGPKPIGIALNPTFDPTVKFAGQPALVIGGSTSVGQYVIQLLRKLSFSP
ncbi:GroES-like protein, partial [Dendrothele bispora CBS 962.96]